MSEPNQPQQDKPSACAGCPAFTSQCVTRGYWDPEARITFLGETPSWPSIGHNRPFVGRNGILLRKLIDGIGHAYADKFPKGEIPHSGAYAAGPMGKPPIAVYNHCSQLWKSQWATHYAQQMGPHVIVAFGLPAAKSAGIMARKILDVRGRVQDRNLGARQVHIIPTLSLATLYAKPGLAAVVQQDILRAVRMAYMEEYLPPKPMEELSKDYVFPKSIEEVRQLCDHIIQYYDPEKQDSPWAWPISVDIETNTLKAFRKDAKVLMISFGWDDGKAAAILLNHADNTYYDPEDAWKEVARVLECPKPKAFHNFKFDGQFIERVRGIHVNNVTWDTLCGQHWMSEDQKGVYGLKALAPIYAPEYEGYEEKLHDALRHGEEIAPTEEDAVKEAQELSAASGAVSDTSWFDGDADTDEQPQPEEVEEDGYALWFGEPPFPEWATPEKKMEYLAYRTAWIEADAIKDKKARSTAKRKWRRVAKELNMPLPDPTNAEDREAEKKGFEAVSINTLMVYAAADADVTRIILKKQWRRLYSTNVMDDAQRVMRELYIPASRALGALEYRGAKVNLDLARDYDSQLTILMDAAQVRIYDLACREFKINASKQLGEILAGMGFTTDQYTANKQMKTSKDVIVGYQKKTVAEYHAAAEGSIDKTFAERKLSFLESLLLYKAAQKMKQSFLRNLRDYASLDGHIHTTFHLTGTSTGRLSSSKLNLQNLPLYLCRITRPNPADPENPIEINKGFNVKALLVPENDDEIFWNLDIKAAEIRVAAYYSGDKALIDAINDDLDVHTFFLTKIKHPDAKDAELREKYTQYYKLYKADDPEISAFRGAVKRVVFGTLYGAGPKKIAAQIGSNFPPEKAKEIIDALFSAFPGIRTYVQNTKREVNAKGFVDTVFGRYRRSLMAGVSRELQSQAEREAVNFRIQSTSSDLVVSQLCEINDHLNEIEATMRLTVHDSMAGTIKRSRVKDMKAFFDKWLVERVKERFPWMPVPFAYDLEVGPSYGEKMKWDKWMKTNASAPEAQVA